MIGTAVVLLSLFAGGPSLVDLGIPDDGQGPLALVVPQPGLRPVAYVALAENLENNGYDAVLMRRSPTPAAQTEAVAQLVESARSSDRPVLLVAHGQGARALLEAGPPEGVCATALLGVPRHPRPAPWHTDFLAAEVPVSGVDLRRSHAAVPAPLADLPRDWLGRLPGAWVAHLQDSLEAAPPPMPPGPTWVGVAPLDELAPPESLGELPDHLKLTRWGMLRGWSSDATYTQLLTDPRPAAHLARWSRRHCTR